MDPKDRIETLAKSKLSHIRERLAGAEAGEAPGARFRVDPADVEATIADWPEAPKKVARETLERYGPPNEATRRC